MQEAPRPRYPRWPLWSAIVALPLLAGYLLLVPWLLDTAWLQARLTPQPGISVAWERARLGWPGTLRVEGFRLAREDPRLPLELAVARARLTVSLPALLTGRLRIRDLQAEGLRDLTLAEHRLNGEGRLRLDGLVLDRDALAAERLVLSLHEATLRRRGLALAEAIRLEADLSLAPFAPEAHPGREALAFLSGSLALAARAEAWELFDPYLAGLGWLALAGHGRLEAELALQAGQPVAGSRLRLDSEALRVELDEAALLAGGADAGGGLAWSRPVTRYRLDGAGRVTATVVESEEGAPAGRLGVELSALSMHRGDRPGPLLSAPTFRLEAELPVDLRHPPTRVTAARLHWQGAETHDLAALARYLPPGLPLALEGGQAALEVALDYRDARLSGEASLVGRELAMTLVEQPLRGDLALDLRLAELDPARQRLDLGGTRLRLAARHRESEAPLRLALDLEEARLWRAPARGSLFTAEGLAAADARLRLRGELDHLAALDSLLTQALGAGAPRLAGQGRFAAELGLAAGRPTDGSRLRLDGDGLELTLPAVTARGAGHLEASWQASGPEPCWTLGADLTGASVTRRHDAARLLQGARLTLAASGSPVDEALDDTALTLEWQAASLPDMAVLNPYLPEATPVRLSGGQADSRGRLTLEGQRLHGWLRLEGQRIAARLFEEAVEGELRLDLVLREATLDGSLLDLSGSRLRLSARAGQRDEANRLGSVLVASRARFTEPRHPERLAGRLVLEGLVDRLGFLTPFLPEAHGLAVAGHGRLAADLRLANAAPQAGSQLRVDGEALELAFLDYRALGRGRLEAWLEAGEASAPAARVRVALPRFALVERDDPEATRLLGRHLEVEIATPRFVMARAPDPEAFTTRIRLPILEVPDLAYYGRYLPADAGLALEGGYVSLDAELLLEGRRAQGDLRLHAFDARFSLADQRLAGDLLLEARLREGDLASRRFDASGTRLRLDNVSRHDTEGRRDAGWWARLDLEEAQLIWRQPLEVESRLALAMRDSGLLARLFLARARERDWLGRLLEVPDIQGEARLRMEQDGVHLEGARLSGGAVTLLADLTLAEGEPSGRLYARFGALAVGVELEAGSPRLRLLRPRRWFDRQAHAAEVEEPDPERWHRDWLERLDLDEHPP